MGKPTYAAYADGLELWTDQIQRFTLRLKIHGCGNLIEDASFLPNTKVKLEDVVALKAKLTTQLAEVEARIDGRRAASAPDSLALDRIAESFGLAPLERDLLCLSLVPELEPAFRSLLSKLRRSVSRDQLDAETAIELLCDTLKDRIAARRCFADSAPLVRERLVVLDDARAGKRVMNYTLRPSPAMIRALLGDAAVENPLSGLCRVSAPGLTLDEVHLPPWKQEVHRIGATHAERLAASEQTAGDPLVLLFLGPPGTGKTMLTQALAHALEMPLMTVSTSALVKKPLDAVRNIELLLLEASLRKAVLFFDDCEALLRRENLGFHDALKLLDGFDGVVVLATNSGDPIDPAFERVVSYIARFATPGQPLREAIWRRQLEGVEAAEDVDPAMLSQRFEMAGGHIRNAVRLARQKAARQPVTRAQLIAAATQQIRADPTSFGEMSKVTLTLDDLVLPEETKEHILEILDACKNQRRLLYDWGFARRLVTGRGISALFDGEPGTGKTLCAEILAAALDRKLLRINVGSLVSKYVGDTEKHISRVFEMARGQQAILLFDEADALFTKRTSVESSQDRFANMETNQLLQEIERHDGITFLTTNLIANLDPAFARRIGYRVQFPYPTVEERAAIWQRLIPDAVPIEDELDFEDLAERFDVSGGYIKNAIVQACYQALAAGRGVTMEDLRDAGRKACEAAGRLVRDRDWEDDF